MSSNLKSQIETLKVSECITQADLNLYDSPECNRLATQATAGRYLQVISLVETPDITSIEVCLREDCYPGWVAISDFGLIQPATIPYQFQSIVLEDIQKSIPDVIAFTHKAMTVDNYYLWGGTLEPNYDCSGLMQAAFRSVGIWLPRDAYQQEAFTETVEITELQPGDLVFFGTPVKATHVGLYLGDGKYIHSSGKNKGRNGIGIDILSEQGDVVSRSYYQQLRGAGRVIKSFDPA
jgi:hypothetical protein